MTPHWPNYLRQVYGVDFSGAVKAGQKIWITSGVKEGDTLCVEACYRGADLPGSGPERDRCLIALRDFIAGAENSVFGLDFPFGLPQALVKEESWDDFASLFPIRYSDPEIFRDACRAGADGSELKRVTDLESRTPFSPYNIRLYRQTYFGIRDVLAPLVQEQKVCVLPMQPALPGMPWLMEICPASTLKRERLYTPYKGGRREHYQARARILEELERRVSLTVPERLRSFILDDQGGDALDSVVAAAAVSRVICSPSSLFIDNRDVYAREGYVYV